MTFVRISRGQFDAESRTEFEEEVIRVQRKSRYAGTRNGSPVFSQMRIFLNPDTSVRPTDKPLIDGAEFEVLSYYAAQDADGVIHHVEVDI